MFGRLPENWAFVFFTLHPDKLCQFQKVKNKRHGYMLHSQKRILAVNEYTDLHEILHNAIIVSV